MKDQGDTLAGLIDRLRHRDAPLADWGAAPAYAWAGHGARPIEHLDAPPLDLLRGIDRQQQAVVANVERLAAGHAAHDMLLWGARGMGKSALIRAATVEAQREDPERLALVQVAADALASLGELFAVLGAELRRFLVFVDDLGFAAGDTLAPRLMRSWLDGGVEARPANVRIAVTTNRRAIVERDSHEQGDPLNPRDAIDDHLALADRFGLSIGFHACSQDEYLAIVRGYAEAHGLPLVEGDALEWASRRGARSGRVAWHYIVELAGRAGKAL